MVLYVANKSVYKIKNLIVKQAVTISEHNTSLGLRVISILCLILLVVVAFILKFHIFSPLYCNLFIESEKGPSNIVNEKFLSLGLDSSVITEGFKHFNMTDPTLIKMMKYLSPAYLRIGGTSADQITFDNCSINCMNSSYNVSNTFVLLGSDWLKLHNLATSAGLDIIYDLNSLLRYQNGSWNPQNAEDMIQFSQENGLELDWELGNEPNIYEHKFDTKVDATQLGLDYISLRNILNKHKMYKNSDLVGPSTTRLRTLDIEKYFTEFLISGSRAVSAITWHQREGRLSRPVNSKVPTGSGLLCRGLKVVITPDVSPASAADIIKGYGAVEGEVISRATNGQLVLSRTGEKYYYFSGVNATQSEFLDPNVFDRLHDCIWTVTIIVRKDLELDKPIWLGETSSAWHGGAPHLSDSFIACFIWIDKLGLSAQMGIDVVVRQSIFKGHYALLNDEYYPNPDWWLSILYKKLVGTSVVGTRYIPNTNENIRLYAHCTKKSALWYHDDAASSIVVFGVNLQDETGFVKIENLQADSKVDVYEVTSESSLLSQQVRLNGRILSLLPNLELPDLTPTIVIRDKTFTMPPYSIVFWVFRNTNVRACME